MTRQIPKLPPNMLAAEIAAGRIKVSIGEVGEPLDAADLASGNGKPFNPSAWKAPAWRSKTKWGRSPDEFVCDDPFEQALAVAVMEQTGLNLPKFDMWADRLPQGNLRVAMAIHRNQLWSAIANGDWVARTYHAREMAVAQVLARDAKRQGGLHRDRRPKVTEWINKQLANDPGAKSPDLWGCAPQWLRDQIGERRFASRVTACRKQRAIK